MSARAAAGRKTASTANALLGLLALRPEWTTWELTTQLRRNMRFFWPRAESRIPAELKRLDRWVSLRVPMAGVEVTLIPSHHQ